MKYLQFLIISTLTTACFGTKPVIENSPKATSEIKITDSVSKTTEPINNITETIIFKNNEPKTFETFDETETTEAFDHSTWNELLQKQVSKEGHVNYKGFKTDRKKLLGYITSLSEITPKDSWSKNEKLAYWINAYNALTIDLILQHTPIKSIKDIKDPWDQSLWTLGNKQYNLNEIEHDILRKMKEPRIHFAIVCASFSCPKLQNKAFIASNLDQQLTNATKEFLTDSKRNSITENSLELSKIFKWFSSDFEQNGSLIDFLNTYSSIKISAKAKIRYKDYNWDLND